MIHILNKLWIMIIDYKSKGGNERNMVLKTI